VIPEPPSSKKVESEKSDPERLMSQALVKLSVKPLKQLVESAFEVDDDFLGA
jgi:hypothetical protein